MAIEERDQTIEEEPSTYNRKTQRAGVLALLAIGAILLLTTVFRLLGGTDVSSSPQRERNPVETRQSPEDESEQFLDRLNRAERRAARENQETAQTEPRTSLLDSLRNERDDVNNPTPVPTAKADTWADKELDRVRSARYDDYDLDLGFAEKAAVARRPEPQSAAQLSPSSNNSVDSAIGNVRREIERAKAYRQQLEQGGARTLLPAGQTASAPVAPLEVGHSRSNSVDRLPQPGQKLLPVTTVIRAVLDQKVVSDYVGPYRAMVIEDVYDVSNRFVLIPKGSTIDGRSIRITNVNEPIQARMALTVNWVVLPNGHKINFSRQYALDREGVAAVKDKVNRHFLAQFLGVAAYAVLTSETSRRGSGFSNDSTFAGDLGESTRREFAPLAQKYLNLVPTITLRPGTPLRVYVAEELYISPWSTVGEAYARYR